MKIHRITVDFQVLCAPRLTPSIRTALADLELDQVLVLYPGDRAYSLAERVAAVPLADLVADPARWTHPPRRAIVGRTRR